MKKFISKTKKVMSAIFLAIISFPSKIIAVSSSASAQDLYGPPKPSTATIIWRIARTFAIPIALVVGLIIYFKKSKSSKKRKILITIGVVAITAILYFVVNKIIYELG